MGDTGTILLFVSVIIFPLGIVLLGMAGLFEREARKKLDALHRAGLIKSPVDVSASTEARIQALQAAFDQENDPATAQQLDEVIDGFKRARAIRRSAGVGLVSGFALVFVFVLMSYMF